MDSIINGSSTPPESAAYYNAGSSIQGGSSQKQ